MSLSSRGRRKGMSRWKPKMKIVWKKFLKKWKHRKNNSLKNIIELRKKNLNLLKKQSFTNPKMKTFEKKTNNYNWFKQILWWKINLTNHKVTISPMNAKMMVRSMNWLKNAINSQLRPMARILNSETSKERSWTMSQG